MPHCHPKNAYQNLFLTVPDRGFSKQELLQFINAWRSDYSFCEIVREPYANPKAGFTHHYHVGLCFPHRVRIGKVMKACNKLKHFTGMDFRTPLVAQGKSAQLIFSKYFKDPSKFKSLDEEPLLVRCRGARPPNPSVWLPAKDFTDRLCEVVKWNHS